MWQSFIMENIGMQYRQNRVPQNYHFLITTVCGEVTLYSKGDCKCVQVKVLRSTMGAGWANIKRVGLGDKVPWWNTCCRSRHLRSHFQSPCKAENVCNSSGRKTQHRQAAPAGSPVSRFSRNDELQLWWETGVKRKQKGKEQWKEGQSVSPVDEP